MEALRKALAAALSLPEDRQEEALTDIRNIYSSPEERTFITDFMMGEADKIERQIEDLSEILENISLRRQIGEVMDILPISYIARHYFNKSASWLSQRLNGNKVRGYSYTLKPEEINIFNNALQDLARRIGSVRIHA